MEKIHSRINLLINHSHIESQLPKVNQAAFLKFSIVKATFKVFLKRPELINMFLMRVTEFSGSRRET